MANTKITSRVLADDAVLTANITDANVTTAKIADDAVTSAKLDTNIDIAGTFDVTGATVLDSTLTVASHVGIGTTSPTTFSGYVSVHHKNTAGDAIHLIESDGGIIGQTFVNDASGVVTTGARSNHPWRVTTNDTERLRVDTSGNVGIGVTPSTWPSNGDFVGLQVGSGLSLYGRGSGDQDRVGMTANAYVDTNDDRFEYIASGHATHFSHTDGNFRFYTAPSGSANGAITFTERLTVLNAGNVGIGTASPATTLHLDASGGAVMRLQRTSSNATNKLELSVDGTDSTITSTNILYISAGTLTVAEFGTGTSATTGSALVVTNYGNVGFGVRPQYYGSNRYIDAQSGANGECLFELRGHNGSGGKFGIRGGVSTGGMGMISNHTLNFLMNQSSVGTLDTSGVLNIDVNDTSDEGLKENVISIADGTTVIKALRPVAFDWKEITAKNEKGEDTVKPARTGQHGFLAQEVESVLPNAIQGTDWVEGKHFAESKSMNSNAVLAHAVKAIQELEARIATLEG